MAQAKLSLSWDAHQKNICNGLSQLQQRGEFVDMTLAADGHLVKVHQMVLVLVSPYIRELITSALCPHPILFLNNISYTTLCSILEYVYTGEVQVPHDQLKDLIAAGRALHIKGLKEMDISSTATSLQKDQVSEDTNTISENLNCKHEEENKQLVAPMCKIYVGETYQDADLPVDDLGMSADSCKETTEQNISDGSNSRRIVGTSTVQYSISNMGSLQLVFNRYIYHTRYIQKNLNRVWRCADYNRGRCHARLITNNRNEVVERISSHNHAFHDAKILQKISRGMIYSAIQEAEDQAKALERKPPNQSDTN